MLYYAFLLEIANKAGAAKTGIATGGTTSTLIDTAREEPANFWQGGTLIVLSGDNQALVKPVYYSNGSTIGINETLTDAIVAGDEYGVIQPKFPLNVLIQSVNSALSHKKYMASDETLTTVADQEAYSLPSGVSNVRRVEIANNTAAPYDFERDFYWYEANGKLYFDSDKLPDSTGNKIRVWYPKEYASLVLTGSVPDAIDYEWLSWQSVSNLWRTYLSQVAKDDPYALEMLNEANAMVSQINQRGGGQRMFPRDVRLIAW